MPPLVTTPASESTHSKFTFKLRNRAVHAENESEYEDTEFETTGDVEDDMGQAIGVGDSGGQDMDWVDELDELGDAGGVDLESLRTMASNYEKPSGTGGNKGYFKGKKEKGGNLSKTSERLNSVMEVMKKAGFRSIGEFLCILFKDRQKTNVNKCGRFFAQGGFIHVMDCWLSDSRVKGVGDKYRQEMMDLVWPLLEKELISLEKSGFLRLPSRSFSHKTLEEFSYENTRAKYKEFCPLLCGLIGRLCQKESTRKRQEKINIQRDLRQQENNEGGSSSSGEEEVILRLRSERLSEDSCAIHEPQNNRPKKLSLITPAERPAPKNPTKELNRQRYLATIVSVILYGRSWQNNYYQTLMGYYLNAEGAGKHCIRTLSGLGLACSYFHIQECEKSNAKSILELVAVKAKKQPFMLSWDNINRLIRVSRELLHNKSHMVNWTTVAIIFLEGPDGSGAGTRPGVGLGSLTEGIALSAEWANEKCRNELTGKEFMLDKDALAHHEELCKLLVSDVIAKYFRRQATVSRVVGGVEMKWAPYAMRNYHLLKLRKSDLHVLKTLPLNEGTLDDTIEIFRRIGDQIEVRLEELKNRRVFCSGDQLSTKLLRASRFLTNEEEDGENLDWTIPVIGLFHLRMSILHMILRFFLGNEDGREPASLNKFKNLLKRTRITEKMPCFKQCEDLVNQVYEGHLIAMLMKELGVEKVDDCGIQFRHVNVDELINSCYEKYMKLGIVEKLREDSGYHELPKRKGKRDLSAAEKRAERLCEEKSDIPFENAVLFVGVVGLYRDMVKGIHEGDTGRIMLTMEYMTIMFQASGLNNYAQELLELSAAFRHEWSEDLKQVYLNNALVNMSGKAGGWMEVDRFQEHVVRTISDRWNPNGNFSSAGYLRDVISPNMMTTKDIKERVKISASGHGTVRGNRNLKERGDVVVIAKEIVKEKVWEFKLGRVRGHGTSYTRCKDLLSEGVGRLLKGVGVEKWKHDSAVKRGGMGSTHQVSLGHVNDEMGDEMGGEEDSSQEEEEEDYDEDDNYDERSTRLFDLGGEMIVDDENEE